ncbi:MAG TPA: RagB/SusD family nutrient uptake outer membrane protein [Gemmatimonadales bacterium]|nr:RagB/SusD family nutrient uptake outer membrane protein [Gemmatimonadales bacterium]
MKTQIIIGALAALALGGCGLLDTEQPNIIDPGTLNSPAGAEALRSGALADFAFVKDGDGTQFQDGLILVAGLLSDEFVHSTTPPSEQEIDQRTTALINPSLSDVYRNLHKARAGAELAAESLQKYLVDPTATTEIAEMQAIAGFAYVYFGEDFCSGVPFSKVRGDTITYGTQQTTTEIFTAALAKFDSALAQPGLAEDDGTITNLATVGRARALLDLDQFTDAADAAAAVPGDFNYDTEHADSPQRLQNAIWSYTNGGLWSVSDVEGGNGLPYISALDPRVQVDSLDDDGDGFADPGLDLITPQYSLLKYPAASSPVPVADGTEAQLIVAEAQLQANNLSGMRTTLNNLRDGIGLGALPTPANRDAAIDMLFSERAFWLYATGHRLGDMRRLIRVYGRDSESVFPTGDYHKNGTYGPDVNLPLPIEEQNNPNGGVCLDRNA